MLILQEIEAAVPDASKKDIGRAYKAVVTLLQNENKVPPVFRYPTTCRCFTPPALVCCCPAQIQLGAHTACLSDSRPLRCHAACPAKL